MVSIEVLVAAIFMLPMLAILFALLIIVLVEVYDR